MSTCWCAGLAQQSDSSTQTEYILVMATALGSAQGQVTSTPLSPISGKKWFCSLTRTDDPS